MTDKAIIKTLKNISSLNKNGSIDMTKVKELVKRVRWKTCEGVPLSNFKDNVSASS